jgi:Lon protease-like protein
MDQIWQSITSADWMTIVMDIVKAICFILTCIILVQAKVNTIKEQARSNKLQEQMANKDADYQAKELALREEYDKKMSNLLSQVNGKQEDLAAKAEAKREAETVKIAADIKQAQASIDEIINK